jgi:anaerobic magnesium-protoporphyrin IX monomethyl ester cyclase
MILLIKPSLREKMGMGIPLGLMYLSSMLRKNGFETKILDYTVDNINLNKEISEQKPFIVGITATYSQQVENTLRLAKSIRKNVLLVTGGNVATIMPERFLDVFDVVVRGEGEYAFLELAQRKPLKDISGISYKFNGRIIHNNDRTPIEPLDKLPFPDYEIINIEKYFNPSTRIDYFNDIPSKKVSVITSRGCPFSCSFCSVHLQMGRKWRSHSVEYVLKHLRLLKDMDIKHINFEDDNLTLDKKRFESILGGMKNMNLTWDTPNGIRADTIDSKLLDKMKQTGLTRLTIGIESGSQRVLDEVIHKKLDLKNVVHVAKLCKQKRINLSAFYIIGMPGETKEEIKITLNFAMRMFKEYNVIPKLSLFASLPGTEMTKICEQNNYIKKGKINTNEFTSDDVARYYKQFNSKLLLPYISKLNWKTMIRNARILPQTIGRFLLDKKNRKM